jgi:hypothetical protein
LSISSQILIQESVSQKVGVPQRNDSVSQKSSSIGLPTETAAKLMDSQINFGSSFQGIPSGDLTQH